MGSLGTPEILLIAFVIFIFFGAKRLPEIARGLGKGVKEFKNATRDIQNELNITDDYNPNQYNQIPPAQPPIGNPQPRQVQNQSQDGNS
jgi:sec-independent protein translocase protein TatA